MNIHQPSYSLRYTHDTTFNYCAITDRSRTIRIYINTDNHCSNDIIDRKKYYEGVGTTEEIVRLHKQSIFYYDMFHAGTIEDAFVQPGNYLNISYKYRR